jgi:capsular polysaccharide biosynthesis protein
VAAVRTPEVRPRSDYRPGDVVDSPTRIVLEAGGQVTTAPPMLWQTGVEMIDRSHGLAGMAPDVDYYVVPDAVLAGGGAMPMVDGAYLYFSSVFPEYVRYFMEGDIKDEFWAHPPTQRSIELPAAISVIHNNIVFGHWLLEMFPKLLLLNSSLQHLRSVPIILPSTAPAYIQRTIQSVLGDWPVVTYDRFAERVEVKTLILPGSMQESYYYHPRANVLFDQDAKAAAEGLAQGLRRAADRLIGRPGPERLFVSRRDVVSGFRKLTNAAELEAIARAAGFRVLAPERMAWRDQVAAFSRAKVIVGEFGSGMHNAIFAPRGAKVVCLNWIVETQSRIAGLRSQSVGYVLPPDGAPKLFSLDGEFTEYQIDPAHFREALERVA